MEVSLADGPPPGSLACEFLLDQTEFEVCESEEDQTENWGGIPEVFQRGVRPELVRRRPKLPFEMTCAVSAIGNVPFAFLKMDDFFAGIIAEFDREFESEARSSQAESFYSNT